MRYNATVIIRLFMARHHLRFIIIIYIIIMSITKNVASQTSSTDNYYTRTPNGTQLILVYIWKRRVHFDENTCSQANQHYRGRFWFVVILRPCQHDKDGRSQI